MQYFTAIIHQDEGTSFGITFPDLPGAFAAADSWDDISEKANEALDLWFEDMPDVAPSSLSEIRKHPDVVAALSEGGTLLPVPYIPADTKTERAQITLERSLLRSIDQVAKERGMSRSSFLASAARRELVGV